MKRRVLIEETRVGFSGLDFVTYAEVAQQEGGKHFFYIYRYSHLATTKKIVFLMFKVVYCNISGERVVVFFQMNLEYY